MGFQNKVGFKLILIYLVSMCLALAAVLLVAESIISQQVFKRHQKKLDALTQKVFFSLEREKDQIRMMAKAIANQGQMGHLVEGSDERGIRQLVSSVFRDSDLDVLYVVKHPGKELFRLQSRQFQDLNAQEAIFIRKAILGSYRVRFNRWEKGILLSSRAPIFSSVDTVTGHVYTGILIDNQFLEELTKDTDSFLAILQEGNVIASTFSKKTGQIEELEFSEDVLQDIKALRGQPLPVTVEETSYTMKSLPLRDTAGNIVSYLVIGLSRGNSPRP